MGHPVAPLAFQFHHFYIPGLIIPVLFSWCCIPVDRFLVLYACVIFLVLYSWFYIPGFIFLVLYFWLCIPGFIILVLHACFIFLDFPGFTFLDLYSWLYIPGFIFLDLYSWFIFLVYIPCWAPEAGGTAGRTLGEPGRATDPTRPLSYCIRTL